MNREEARVASIGRASREIEKAERLLEGTAQEADRHRNLFRAISGDVQPFDFYFEDGSSTYEELRERAQQEFVLRNELWDRSSRQHLDMEQFLETFRQHHRYVDAETVERGGMITAPHILEYVGMRSRSDGEAVGKLARAIYDSYAQTEEFRRSICREIGIYQLYREACQNSGSL